jgi:hypothetical protein
MGCFELAGTVESPAGRGTCASPAKILDVLTPHCHRDRWSEPHRNMPCQRELGSYIVWLVVGAGPDEGAEGKRNPHDRGSDPRFIGDDGAGVSRDSVADVAIRLCIHGRNHVHYRQPEIGSAGLLIQVVSLASLYGVVFAPRGIGWAAAGNFAGSAIAFGLIVVFDNWLWRDRAEPILIETLRASAARHHQRPTGATRFYLNAHAAPRPQEPPPTSELPQHLALLQRAVVEGLTTHRRAVLLAAITRLARIQIETDRLIIAVREDVPRQVRAMMRPEIERVVDAITAALDDMAHDASSLMRSGADRRPSAAAFRARLLMDAVTACIDHARRVYSRRAGGPEVANSASFIDCLMVLTLLIERPLDEPPGGAALNRISPAASEVGRARDTRAQDMETLGYSLKVGFCAVGYVIGLASQRPELSVILTTIVITALPTYGASLRKNDSADRRCPFGRTNFLTRNHGRHAEFRNTAPIPTCDLPGPVYLRLFVTQQRAHRLRRKQIGTTFLRCSQV